MQNIGLVLDTNVLVSAHLNTSGMERFIFDLALSSKVRFYVSDEIMREYMEVLIRPKFGLSKQKLTESFSLIQSATIWIQPKGVLHVASDPDDNKFLECAEAATADYLVTGNKRRFPKHWKSTEVVGARELATILLTQI